MALVDESGVEAGANRLDGAAAQALDTAPVLIETVADLIGTDLIDVEQGRFFNHGLLRGIHLATERTDAGFVLRIKGGQVRGKHLPLAEEDLRALFDRVEVKEFFNRDGPADDDHDGADADGDPAVEHHVIGNVAEERKVLHQVALLPCPAAFDLAERDRALSGIAAALGDGDGLDPCGVPRAAGDTELVDFAAEAGLGGTESERIGGGGQRAIEGGIGLAIEEELEDLAIGDQREMVPNTWRERHRRSGGTGLARQLDQRFALVEQDGEITAAEEHRLVLQGGGLEPEGDGQVLSGLPFEAGAIRDADRGAGQAQAVADDRSLGGGTGVGSGVVVWRGIGRRGSATGEVIGEHRAFIEGIGGLESGGHGRIGVAGIDMQRFLRRLEVGQLDPDEGLVEQVVITLDLVRQHGFAIGGEDADVAAILTRGGKWEVRVGQAQQHGHRAGGLTPANGGTIDGEGLALGPRGVPPWCRGFLCRGRNIGQ